MPIHSGLHLGRAVRPGHSTRRRQRGHPGGAIGAETSPPSVARGRPCLFCNYNR
jgi:hypothetical protein